MVARITHSSKLSSILNYNEKKVSQLLPSKDPDDPPKYAAELIHASGFLKDAHRLTFREKSERFHHLNQLREATKKNMLHISLNFDPTEKLTNDQLAEIANRYIEGIGLAKQPYLVYRHNDAGHPHLHIVTNIIQSSGDRINTHLIARNKSEPTRKTIEKEFNLVRAERSLDQRKLFELQPVDPQKLEYGSGQETKKAMQQILRVVGERYKFTSLPEYNAVLRQFNLVADPGAPGGRIARHDGLVYRVLNEQGQKVGPPIKASSFYFKPTMAKLEEKYRENRERRKSDLPGIRSRIDWQLRQHPDSFRNLVEGLRGEGIEVVIRQNDAGRIYGLTYVDNQSKTVVNGSDLGKNYSAGPILSQYEIAEQQAPSQKQISVSQKPTATPPSTDRSVSQEKADQSLPQLPLLAGFNSKVPQLLSTLMRYEQTYGASPQELSMDQKTRRRMKL
jgi:hypothetical protein